jgi:hypothetical protein
MPTGSISDGSSDEPVGVLEEVGHVDQVRIAAFAGSLRRASYNRGLVRAAAAAASKEVTFDVLDLAPLPLYNQDVEDAGEPAAVVALKRAIGAADALLVATPEYSHHHFLMRSGRHARTGPLA